jgi:predicted glycosyltransferase
MRILVYVQHLLGAGHLIRSMSLAEALSQSGFDVLLVSGGFPVERHVRGYLHYQLPPTRAIEGDFTRLVDQQGCPINDDWRDHRAAQLLAEVDRFRPGLIITETFPFGRRQFRFELQPLIHWVKSRKNVYLMASVRDVLQRRTEPRDRLTLETIHKYYDAVLVHADDRLFKLDASFSLSYEIEEKLIYTGYIHHSETNITPSDQLESSDGEGEIIVSGGSGTVSARLIETARRARALSSARSHVWRLLTGRNQSTLKETAEPGIIIEPNRADFFSLLRRCALSVSQAGYNTTLDVLASGARSLMVPFAGDGETEQNDRAQALARAGRLIQIPESELSPKRLAYAIDRALEMTPVKLELNLDGANQSARLIKQKLAQWQV